jgi:tRNA A37 threonylcarbamoyladenosine dehydratase
MQCKRCGAELSQDMFSQHLDYCNDCMDEVNQKLASIEFAKSRLRKELIIDQDAVSQIRRMIVYEEESIRKEYPLLAD